MRSDPKLYQRDCNDCRKYQYIEEGQDRGEIYDFRGSPMERPPSVGPPCTFPVGCQKGHYRDQKTLWHINECVVMHYDECKAVGVFPDDAIVRRNAAIIKRVEEMLAEVTAETTNEMLKALALRGVV